MGIKLMKVIIAGSRSFDDAMIMFNYCNKVLSRVEESIEIVSGGAKGADRCGECFAEMKGYPVRRFLPNWDKHGKKAGILRNTDMANYADALIAFWDGKSKGTKHMIETAKSMGLKVRVKLV